jgi:hypothetical protein
MRVYVIIELDTDMRPKKVRTCTSLTTILDQVKGLGNDSYHTIRNDIKEHGVFRNGPIEIWKTKTL